MDRASQSARATRVALDEVRQAPSLLAGMRAIEPLSDAAASDSETAEVVRLLLTAILDPTDQLAAIAAALALGAVADDRAALALVSVLRDGPSWLRDHAAWALAGCAPVDGALPLLVASAAEGGFRGMLAQRTLETWALRQPDDVRVAVARGLSSASLTVDRSRLVETLGLVPGEATQSLLRGVVLSDAEDETTRATAIAALGDPPPVREERADRAEQSSRTASPPTASSRTASSRTASSRTAPSRTVNTLTLVASQEGALAAVAQLALDDLRAKGRSEQDRSRPPGRTVAQLYLHAEVDGALTHSGRGDAGGIATLLVHLGDALLRAEPQIHRVLTLSRGGAAEAVSGLTGIEAPGHHYLAVPLWGQAPQAGRSWPLWVAARRGIRRVLREAGSVDALHLRMADVGALAAASAAHELGVPLVVTLAPDPHALVAARERSGELTRANVGEADEVEHFVFRDSLLRQLGGRAEHVVVFPRPNLERDLLDLIGIDVTAQPGRVSVVPEGVQFGEPLSPRQLVTPTSAESAAALRDLDELLDGLPDDRRGLPLAISVGRMHPVKGMATLVAAWAGSAMLSDRCNLLVVGGDLEDPNDDEREQLERIEAVVTDDPSAAAGLLLAGHRPNATVTAWLAAARWGRADLAAVGGVYVSASLKEEFGISILEAMATGLVVVAPGAGGPATYVTTGESGVLTDTGSPEALATAIGAALDLAASPTSASTAERTMATVRERFGIDTMASALAGIYDQVVTTAPAQRAGGRAS